MTYMKRKNDTTYIHGLEDWDHVITETGDAKVVGQRKVPTRLGKEVRR
jgi:hypothetical protein